MKISGLIDHLNDIKSSIGDYEVFEVFRDIRFTGHPLQVVLKDPNYLESNFEFKDGELKPVENV